MNLYAKKSCLQHNNLSLSKDRLIHEKRTLLSHGIDMRSLLAFSPEIKLIKSGPGAFAKWLFQIGCVLTVYFSVTLFRHSLTHLPLFLALDFSFFIISILYYYYKINNSKLAFYLIGHEKPLFKFLSPKDKNEEKRLINTFNKAVLNARVHATENDLSRLNVGIDNLEKQKIISNSFAEELRDRVSHLDDLAPL